MGKGSYASTVSIKMVIRAWTHQDVVRIKWVNSCRGSSKYVTKEKKKEQMKEKRRKNSGQHLTRHAFTSVVLTLPCSCYTLTLHYTSLS